MPKELPHGASQCEANNVSLNTELPREVDIRRFR